VFLAIKVLDPHQWPLFPSPDARELTDDHNFFLVTIDDCLHESVYQNRATFQGIIHYAMHEFSHTVTQSQRRVTVANIDPIRSDASCVKFNTKPLYPACARCTNTQRIICHTIESRDVSRTDVMMESIRYNIIITGFFLIRSKRKGQRSHQWEKT
jgi:hypothetical protein